ncbi:MAG: hypothetical protein Q9165_000050 [Trypethelium subeluteriae]
MAMIGPHDEGYIDPEGIEMIYKTQWKVSHNASRSAIRLIGPIPKWARKDGGEGGAHPSNVVEYGYNRGAMNFTGDEPCIFSEDCPNFGGFISSTTVIRAEFWKLGQIRAGDMIQYRRVSLVDALAARASLDEVLDIIESSLREGKDLSSVSVKYPSAIESDDWGKSIISEREAEGNQPSIRYRQGGDDYLIVQYGFEQFDLNHRCRVTALESALCSTATPSSIRTHLINTVGCCTTLTIFYDGFALSRFELVTHLQALEARLGDLSTTKVPCRRFRLPITFHSREQDEATARYMANQRPHAPYLPDNLAFVARNNALTSDQLKHIYLTETFMAVVVGFFCGNTVSLPVDPRCRLSAPKMNPSRVFTPAGTVGWAGSCMSIYPVDSPGGYQMTGRTIPIFDLYGAKPGFAKNRPWLFRDFDLLTYYEVDEEEMRDLLRQWETGRWLWSWEEVEFDMEEHNRLLVETKEEVKVIRERQAAAQEEMNQAEEESLRKWREEKDKNKVDDATVEKLLDDPSISTVEAPVDANVWKVEVEEGKVVKPGQGIVVLEAMKLEIAVKVPDDTTTGTTVEKLLVMPGDTVKAGGKLALLKRT